MSNNNSSVGNDLPKLVRDNIPEIIREQDKQEPIFHIAKDDDEFGLYLKKKIVEEAAELTSIEDKDVLVYSIVDVLEVIDALKKLYNISNDEIQKAKIYKQEKNGAYTKRFILEGKK